MQKFIGFLSRVPLLLVILFCLTLGLAPFRPPHVWEKLVMLVNGDLSQPIDIFDLFLHSAPWFLLVFRLVLMVRGRRPPR